MSYAFLAAAIAAEIVATSLLKHTDGFSRLWPTVLVLSLYGLAFLALAQAVRDLPVGLVYALWAGLGTAAIAVIGVTFLGEPMTLAKLLGVLLVIGGVVVLNLGGAH